MKKTGKILIASLFVVGLLSLTLSQAFAAGLVDPVAKPTVEGTEFEAVVLAQNELPGTVEGLGLTLPVGFPEGQAQFGGKGLMLSELMNGDTATVCFDFRYYHFEWWGFVAMWDGTSWVKLPTTVSQPDEGATTWACASGVGDGTYALIMGSYGKPKAAPTEDLG